MKYLWVVFFLAFNVHADDGIPAYFEPFASEYLMGDFNLSANYHYWEIRRGEDLDVGVISVRPDLVLQEFDAEAYYYLTQEQVDLLTEADSDQGFDFACMPGYCPIYGVAVKDNGVEVIDSRQGLLDFFSYIDTPAEVLVWLSVNDYQGVSFMPSNNGYQAVASWDDLCGKRGLDLIVVDRLGGLERIKEISTETYEGCVEK